jgi:hypothetical protein
MIVSASTPNGNPDPGLVPSEIVATLSTHRDCLRYMSASACCAWCLTACVSTNPQVPNKSIANLSCVDTKRSQRVVPLSGRKILTSDQQAIYKALLRLGLSTSRAGKLFRSVEGRRKGFEC